MVELRQSGGEGAAAPDVPAAGRRRTSRPAWWRELIVVSAVYGLDTLTRNTLPTHRARARANAKELYHTEQHLRIDIERTLNDLVAGRGNRWLAVLANYTYSLSYLVVTLSVLVWLYVTRPRAYQAARTALLVTTALGLLGYWLYPLAPPRFFPELGFVDTVVRDQVWGSWGSPAVAAASNQYAAMPSLHMGWSVWAAAAVAVWARPRWLRAAALLYPLVVFADIVGTANHWALDGVGGLLAAAIGAVVAIVVPSAGRARSGHFASGEGPGPDVARS